MKAQKQFGSQGWTPARMNDLSGKTYVITGANSGAGFEATRLLLSKGAHVVMMNRNLEKSQQAIALLKQEFGANAPVSFVQLDLASLDSVRSAAQKLLQQTTRIDALLCNGAIAQVAKQELTVDGFESQLGVNHLGHFLLCGLLFERLEASQGRIVVVGSNAYKMGLKKIQFDDLNYDKHYTAWNAYAQSKLAQMMFAYELQRRIKAANKTLGVYVCHPGASRTNLLKDTASALNKMIWGLMAPIMAQSAEKGAWPEVMCATQPSLLELALYGPTKRMETVGAVDQCPLAPLALDKAAAQQLWQVSEQKTVFQWGL
ncbi:SDR family oxidoreductase [Marinomonas dokdonensis]|uniref:SDR family oxidoreductase n=1 Tax=Marinomonas dokdonensis TaxID=328224 RepID=UPI0040558129